MKIEKSRALLLAAMISFAPIAASAETYLKQAPDVPVIEGYSEVEAISSAFDKPEGRILEAFLAGSGKAEEALAFYARTLPQLGWQLETPEEGQSQTTLRFAREQEHLSLSVVAETNRITVLLLQIEPLAE